MISREMYEELLDYLESIKDVEIDTAHWKDENGNWVAPDIGATDMLVALRLDHDIQSRKDAAK